MSLGEFFFSEENSGNQRFCVTINKLKHNPFFQISNRLELIMLIIIIIE